MDGQIDFDSFETEINDVVEELLKNFGDYNGVFPNYEFVECLNRFSVEVTVFNKEAEIKTFHLQRDEKIYGQYNKVEVVGSIIGAFIEDSGQVKFNFNASGIKTMPGEFSKSHLKKHSLAVSNFIGKLKKNL